jgi:hypothetical protein
MCENLFIVATQFVTKKQLKDLTNMFYLWIPCYKLYKKGLLSYVLTLKYMHHLQWVKKNLTQKVKYIIKFFFIVTL